MSVAYSTPLQSTRHHSARAYGDLRDWLASLQLKGRADRTLDDYERTIAALFEWKDLRVKDYTLEDLEQFVLVKYGPNPGARVRISHLNSFFGWLLKRERVTRNVASLLEPPRAHRQKVVEVFSEAEIALLTSLPNPDGALLTIMLYTGIRKSECRNLQRRHIALFLDNADEEPYGELTVYEGKGRKDRVIPFGQRCVQAVAALDILEGLNPEAHLWSYRPGGGSVIKRDHAISDTAMHRWWAAKSHDKVPGVLARADVTYRNMHTTRHTYATRLIRRGARLENVQKLMGHTSIQTTVDIYGHLTLADAIRDVRLLEAVL